MNTVKNEIIDRLAETRPELFKRIGRNLYPIVQSPYYLPLTRGADDIFCVMSLLQCAVGNKCFVTHDGGVEPTTRTDNGAYWQKCETAEDYEKTLVSEADNYINWYNNLRVAANGPGSEPEKVSYSDIREQFEQEDEYQQLAEEEQLEAELQRDEEKIGGNLADRYMDTTKHTKQSGYRVEFEFDRCDADYASTATGLLDGKMCNEVFIKLLVAAHFRDLSDYGGEWFNLGPLQEFLSGYVGRGYFHDAYNRFKIENVSVVGYDADKDVDYRIDMNRISISELGIGTIDELYDRYIKQSIEED